MANNTDSGRTQTKINNRVIVVTYRLPLGNLATNKHIDEKYALDNVGVVAGITALKNSGTKVTWVGYGGLGSEIGPEKEELEAQMNKIGLVPVYIETEIARAHFNDFCKGIIWPLFHYHQSGQGPFTNESWSAYEKVNSIFADKIASIYSDGDLIFIQDYHLMLLPSMLRSKLPKARIGFFMHIPWPSSELYRTLPVRSQVLHGILGADIIGFQTFAYSRHFVSACTKVLGVGTTSDSRVEVQSGREVRIEVVPVGIDSESITTALKRPETRAKVDELKKSYEGKRIIVSRDRTEYIKAIPKKLKAFEALLNVHPEWHGKLVLFQECRPNTEVINEQNYADLCEEIEQLVGRINGKFGTLQWTPVHYLNKKLKPEETWALFSIADVALVTPLRDGMNLTCLEFVACQSEKMGPLILSEFAGSAQCLSGAILVNPWDQQRIVRAINEALNMNDDQKKKRHKHNMDYVKGHDALFWAQTFLKELSDVEPCTRSADNLQCITVDEICEAYQKSKNRLFLFDYDGTLSPIARVPAQAAPTLELLSMLNALGSDPQNSVYVISGRDRKTFDEWLGSLPIGMSCEHGCFFKLSPKDGDNHTWQTFAEEIDLSWKDEIVKIFEDFADLVPGSFVELKESAVTWHYRNADSIFAEYQKKDLLLHLQNLAQLPIEIVPGKKAVEIRPQGINKGSIVKRLLSIHTDADFILCLGDDKTDEDMFEALKDVQVPQKFTVTVEKKPSVATYYFEDQKQVTKLLEKLTKQASQEPKP